MLLKIDRYTLIIEPESAQDIAFIEDTLRLSDDGETIRLERIDGDKNTFRLETDIVPPVEENSRMSTGGTFKRPIEDFIDVAGSWDRHPAAPITQVDLEEEE